MHNLQLCIHIHGPLTHTPPMGTVTADPPTDVLGMMSMVRTMLCSTARIHAAAEQGTSERRAGGQTRPIP
jgi:hypothetical protein